MKKFAAVALIFFLCSAAFAKTKPVPIRLVDGRFVSLYGGVLQVKTAPDVLFRIPVRAETKIVSSSGYPFFRWWLAPGDGVRVNIGKSGIASVVTVYAAWHSGAVAFVSANRLTTQEGDQFFLTPDTPVYLNGSRLSSAAGLKPYDSVLIRFDDLHESVAGVWAFDFTQPQGKSADIFDVSAAVVYPSPENAGLRIEVKARAGGKLTVELSGAFGKRAMEERAPGRYVADVRAPQGIFLGKSYLRLDWEPRAAGRHAEVMLSRAPVAIYTAPPAVVDAEPDQNGAGFVNPPLIFATFDPDGTPLAPESVQLFLDGRDVTKNCYRDATMIFLSPEDPLSAGTHVCVVKGKSLDGGYALRKEWRFTLKKN